MPTNKPSITKWNRLEPRSQAPSILSGLAAKVRDPLWFLARQWQMGEFRGEDAGSPAFVQFSATLWNFTHWGAEGGTIEQFSQGAPLEKMGEGECFAPDITLRVELGQLFEALLAEQHLGESIHSEIVEALRRDHPIPPVDSTGLNEDRELVRFLQVCSGGAPDGVKIYLAAKDKKPILTGQLSNSVTAALNKAALALEEYVEEVYGEISKDPEDPSAWKPERLEYRLETAATRSDGVKAVLRATPDLDGSLDWYGFDLNTMEQAPEIASAIRFSTMPGHVRFRGMPNARWWDFEPNTTPFGEIKPDKRDLSKLLLMDFMLIQGNDWFNIPFDQPVGTLCKIDFLLLQDVFGQLFLIERADANPTSLEKRWTMFSLAKTGVGGETADFFALPPTAVPFAQLGPTLEEVRFLRDEMANMVWAVEHTTENGLGEPWSGHERETARRAATPPPAAGDTVTTSPLRYLIQTQLPENWIPFMPVMVGPADQGQIALERTLMSEKIRPRAKILLPTSISQNSPYRIFEEEVPREGVSISRAAVRSRWIDGSTHLWIMRRQGVGKGEGSSGLRFDQALTTKDQSV